ncbi:Formin homology 2 domain (FH2 domain)-containing protein [Dioscorea alata]|nr:Formin homology 2 domain (FH2 domain)-containing protein [Dioscorea alata]
MENQQQEKGNEQDSLLSLFDTLWFYHPILFHNPPPPSPPPPAPAPEPIHIKVVQRIRSHRRSLSDEQLLHIPSPSTATNSHSKLQTILSGKESTVLQENTSIEIKKTGNNNNKYSKRRLYRRRGSSSTKSLSDLEFEELKGFMDLGFTFSNAETDPRLMSIVPGLRRRVACSDDEKFESERHGSDDDDDEEGGRGVVRPYLSEAWEVEEERRLRNWKIPASVEGVDMKDCLRLWAQAVASTVR